MNSKFYIAALAVAVGFGCSTAQAAVIYQSVLGVDVNGLLTPDLSSVATPSVTVSATFDPTPAGGGGVVVDELGQPAPDVNWHDSQIEVEADGTVLVSVWYYGDVGVLDLGTANFGTDNTVSFAYDDATGLFTGDLNGVQTSISDSPGVRATPVQNGGSQYYGFGVGDSTNMGNGQSFVGTIDDVTITADAMTGASAPEPAAWALMLAGIGGLGLSLRSRRRTTTASA